MRRKLAALATAAAMTALLGVASSTAQAKPVAHVATTAVSAATVATGPCEQSEPDICIYQGSNYTGSVCIVPTAANGGVWFSIRNVCLGYVTVPWGSFHDLSGSSVVFGDDQTGDTKCYIAHTSEANPSVTHYGYFWIEFGVTNCTGTVGPLP